jgi:Leucine-rich repeat (LRR) protein
MPRRDPARLLPKENQWVYLRKLDRSITMVRRSKSEDASSSAESSTSIAVSEDAANTSSSSLVASSSSVSSATVASAVPNHPTPPPSKEEEEEEEDNSEEAFEPEEDASISSSSSVTASSHASSASSTTIPVDLSSHHDEDDDFSVDPRNTNIPRSSLRSTLHSKPPDVSSSSGTSASETVITEVTGLPTVTSNAKPGSAPERVQQKKSASNPRLAVTKKTNPNEKKAPPPGKVDEDSSSSSSSSKDASSSSETVASDRNEEDASESSSGTLDSETVKTSETTPSEPKKQSPVGKSKVVRTETKEGQDSIQQSGGAIADSDTVPSVEVSENSSQSPVRTKSGKEDDEDDDASASEEESEASEEEEASSTSASESLTSSASSTSEVSQGDEEDNATSESETVETEVEKMQVVSASKSVSDWVESPTKRTANSHSARALGSQPVRNVQIESVQRTEKQFLKPEKGLGQNDVSPGEQKSLGKMLEKKLNTETEVPQLVQSKSFGEDVSVITDDSSIKHLEKLEIGGKASDAVSCMNSIEESINPSEEDDDDGEQKTIASSTSQSKMGGGIHLIYHDSKPSINSDESSLQPDSNSMLNLDLDGNAVKVFNLGDQFEHSSIAIMNKIDCEEPDTDKAPNDHVNEEFTAQKVTRNVTTKKSGLFGRFKLGLNLSARSQTLKHEPVPNMLSNVPVSAKKPFGAFQNNDISTEHILKENRGVQGLPDIAGDISASAESKVTVVHSTPINSQDQALFEAQNVPVPVKGKSERIKGFGRARSFDSSGDEGAHFQPKQSLFGFLRRSKFKKHSSFDEYTPVESHIVNESPEAPRISENPSEGSQLGFRLVDDAVFESSSQFGKAAETEVTDVPLENSEPADPKLSEVFDNNFAGDSNDWNAAEQVQYVEMVNDQPTNDIGEYFATFFPDASELNKPIIVASDDSNRDSVVVTRDIDVFLSNVSEDASDEEAEPEREEKDEENSSSASESVEAEPDREEEDEESSSSASDNAEDDISLSESGSESIDENESTGDVEASESRDSEESESEKSEEETESSGYGSDNIVQSGSLENSDDDSDSEEEGCEILSEEEEPVFVDFVDLSDMISVSPSMSNRVADAKVAKPIEDKDRALDAFESNDEPVYEVSDTELFTGFNFYATSNVVQNQDEECDAVDDELTDPDEPESAEDSSDALEEEDSSDGDHTDVEDEPVEEQPLLNDEEDDSSHSEAVLHEKSIAEGCGVAVTDDWTENKFSRPVELDTDEAQTSSDQKPRRKSILAMFGLESKAESQPEYVSNVTYPSLFVVKNTEYGESPPFSPEEEKNAYEVEEVLGSAAFIREESFSFQELNSDVAESPANNINRVESYNKSKSFYVAGNTTPREEQKLVDSAIDLMGGYGSDDYAEGISSATVPSNENRKKSKDQKGYNLFRRPIFTRNAKKVELDDRSLSERHIEPVFFAQTSPESHGIIDVELGDKVTTATNSAEYDVNMEHSSSLVSDDFRINEVPRRMSIGSTMSPKRMPTNSSPRKSSIASPRKLSIPGTLRKLSMSSSNSALSNWLKSKEPSLLSSSKSELAEPPFSSKEVVNSVDLEDISVGVDNVSVNHRVDSKSYDDDIESGISKKPKSEKSKSSRSDKGTSNTASKDKECHQYCRMIAIVILAIVGLVIGVVIGTVVGGDSDADSKEKGIPPAPATVVTPTAVPLPLLPTQSPILHQDVYETLCSLMPDCSPLLDATSPQGRAFQWLTADSMTGDGSAQVVTRFSLASFYYSTNGENWVDASNWLSTLDVCDWYTSSINAPVCDNEGRFVVLDLKQNNVTGTLPMEIGLLTDLTSVSIRNPSENNTTFLSGRLDTMFQAIPGASLTKLTSLSLVGNQFIGGIPTELNTLTLLRTLDLSFNDLFGDVPYQLDALSNLQYVNLSNNKLTGGIPSELFNAATNMIDLNLNGNVFTSVAESIGSLTSLSRLNIGNNELVVFPSAIMSLSNLQSLDLSNNQFGGPLPSALGAMSNLQELSLQRNDMTGEIPSAIGNLVQLTAVLNLSENQFYGTIPVSFNQLVRLQALHLHSNRLSGPIPAELIRWNSMETLRIDGNALTGTIPILLCQEWSLLRSYADCREFNASSTGDSPSTCFTFCCDASADPSCVCNYEASEPLRCLAQK